MLEGVLEGILFVSGEEGLEKSRILEILEIKEDEFNKLVDSLCKNYEEQNRGIRIELLGGKYKLVTKKEHNEFYKKMMDCEKND